MSFCADSWSEEVEAGRAKVPAGRRDKQRLKSGEGKTVRDLTRMAVTVSSRER